MHMHCSVQSAWWLDTPWQHNFVPWFFSKLVTKNNTLFCAKQNDIIKRNCLCFWKKNICFNGWVTSWAQMYTFLGHFLIFKTVLWTGISRPPSDSNVVVGKRSEVSICWKHWSIAAHNHTNTQLKTNVLFMCCTQSLYIWLCESEFRCALLRNVMRESISRWSVNLFLQIYHFEEKGSFLISPRNTPCLWIFKRTAVFRNCFPAENRLVTNESRQALCGCHPSAGRVHAQVNQHCKSSLCVSIECLHTTSCTCLCWLFQRLQRRGAERLWKRRITPRESLQILHPLSTHFRCFASSLVGKCLHHR